MSLSCEKTWSGAALNEKLIFANVFSSPSASSRRLGPRFFLLLQSDHPPPHPPHPLLIYLHFSYFLCTSHWMWIPAVGPLDCWRIPSNGPAGNAFPAAPCSSLCFQLSWPVIGCSSNLTFLLWTQQPCIFSLWTGLEHVLKKNEIYLANFCTDKAGWEALASQESKLKTFKSLKRISKELVKWVLCAYVKSSLFDPFIYEGTISDNFQRQCIAHNDIIMNITCSVFFLMVTWEGLKCFLFFFFVWYSGKTHQPLHH